VSFCRELLITPGARALCQKTSFPSQLRILPLPKLEQLVLDILHNKVLADIKSDCLVGKHETMPVHIYNYFYSKYKKDVRLTEQFLVQFLGSIDHYCAENELEEHQLVVVFSWFCGFEGKHLPLEALDRMMMVFKCVSERAGRFLDRPPVDQDTSAGPATPSVSNSKLWFSMQQVRDGITVAYVLIPNTGRLLLDIIEQESVQQADVVGLKMVSMAVLLRTVVEDWQESREENETRLLRAFREAQYDTPDGKLEFHQVRDVMCSLHPDLPEPVALELYRNALKQAELLVDEESNNALVQEGFVTPEAFAHAWSAYFPIPDRKISIEALLGKSKSQRALAKKSTTIIPLINPSKS